MATEEGGDDEGEVELPVWFEFVPPMDEFPATFTSVSAVWGRQCDKAPVFFLTKPGAALWLLFYFFKF